MTDLVVEPEPAAPRRRNVLPVVLGVLAALALVVGVVVVLSDSNDTSIEDPVSLIGSAPDAAREAGTARMSMRMEMSGDGMSVDMDGEGLVDFVSGATSFEMAMFGMSFEMRMVDSTIYMRMPGAAALPDGAEWVAMPVTIAGGAVGGPLTPGGTGLLESLRGVSDQIEELGTKEVNGVEAHGYRAVVDMAAAMQEVPDQYREELEASLAQLEGLGLTSMPTEIWMTDDGLPVRQVVTMETDVFDMTMTMDWSDFGIDVDVQPPPAELTTTVSDQRQLQELLGGVAG